MTKAGRDEEEEEDEVHTRGEKEVLPFQSRKNIDMINVRVFR